MRLDIRRIGSVKGGDEIIGNQVKVKVIKNKVAPPFRLANFDIMFNRGINVEGELLDLGVTHKIVSKSGTWMSYGETRLGQGRERSAQFLIDNPDIRAELESKIRAICFPDNVPDPDKKDQVSDEEKALPEKELELAVA